MSGEDALVSLIVMFAAVVCVCRWIRSVPAPPDPWEPEINNAELNGMDSPVCVNCLRAYP